MGFASQWLQQQDALTTLHLLLTSAGTGDIPRSPGLNLTSVSNPPPGTMGLYQCSVQQRSSV